MSLRSNAAINEISFESLQTKFCHVHKMHLDAVSGYLTTEAKLGACVDTSATENYGVNNGGVWA